MQTATAQIARRRRLSRASASFASLLVLAASAATTTPSTGKATAQTAPERARQEGAGIVEQTRIVARRVVPAPSYGWPVKPFNRQHPIRGYFNDPRNGEHDHFHFGIDISVPDGTPVYAVEAGQVFLEGRSHAVAVKGKTRVFGYWHVVLAVRDRQFVRAHQLLGHVARGWGHVHFAESSDGRHVNPLRPGALGPYADRTAPAVTSVEFFRNGRPVDANRLEGRVDIVVEAFDTTPMPVRRPWNGLPVTPARVRWGIARTLRTAVDFGGAHLPGNLYNAVYARGTRQNRAGRPGRYRFFLARGFDASRLPAAGARLQVNVTDTRGNLSRATIDVALAAAR